MATHKSTKTEAPRNDDLTNEEQMAFATMAALADIDLKKIAAKFAIGYAYVMTGYVACWNIAVMLALLTSVVWLQYVIVFAVLAVTLAGVIYTTPVVVDTVYNGIATVFDKTKSLFSSVKEKFTAPRTATVH